MSTMLRKLILVGILIATTAIQAQDSSAVNSLTDNSTTKNFKMQAQAVMVYGQTDFTSNAPNRGGQAGADTLNYPLGLALDPEGGLYVADRNNHRVLYFANDGDISADRVYGQYGSFTAHINNNDGNGNSGAPGPESLAMPTTIALDKQGGLYVTDRENRRMLYFGTDGDTTADRVYGQFGNFKTNMVNNDSKSAYGEPSADNISVFTLGVATDNKGGVYLSDAASHRILYFADDGDTTADRVYGQFDDFTTDARNNDGTGRRGNVSASSLNFPRGLLVDGSNGLYIADRDNNRVLYFADDGDTVADRVYGQFGSFTTNAENNDGSGNAGTISANSLSHPKSIVLDSSGGLYIADTLNHRILYFAPDGDTIADQVFGQYGSFTTGVVNNDGNGLSGTPNEQSLNGPQGMVLSPDGKLYIADTDNNRILVIQISGS